MENKLKIISNAFGYADLMDNHINKENKVMIDFWKILMQKLLQFVLKNKLQ